MKKLALLVWICLAAAVVCATLLVVAFATRFPGWEYCAVFTLMGSTIAAAMLLVTRKKLMAARAIAESAIICIQPAVIRGRAEEEKEGKELCENFGIYVSCFGILLGTKVIEFNRNGIWLKNVDIGHDHISFGYGAPGEETHSIRLLYSKPCEDELAGIIEDFRKETGIVPVVTAGLTENNR